MAKPDVKTLKDGRIRVRLPRPPKDARWGIVQSVFGEKPAIYFQLIESADDEQPPPFELVWVVVAEQDRDEIRLSPVGVESSQGRRH